MPDRNRGRAGGTTRRRELWRWLGILLLAGVGVIVARHHARAWRAGPERDEALALGERLYAENCAPCHGVQMQGALGAGALIAPPLAKFGFRFFFCTFPGGMEGFVCDQIANGAEGIPEFGTRLSARDIGALAYLIHQRKVWNGLGVPPGLAPPRRARTSLAPSPRRIRHVAARGNGY